ncbi:hypothetical protein ZIOFF_032092 [Zingiber officinale]|uniref:Bidirectional sugar transporter SWEET n=1 Tax=Zingiber officinale TaxID=94328 RepID=A0A8J5GN27_ZINOF|nr:hypothetical protein ZIOFF_032092 [Zingiber officinale]
MEAEESGHAPSSACSWTAQEQSLLFSLPTVWSVTFLRIIRSRSTEDFSGVPYNMTLLNCLLSAWYGLPFVSPDNILVSTVNGAGAAIEAVYVVIFLVFASKPSVRAHTAVLLAAVLSAFAAVAVISLELLDGQPRKLCRSCGW